MEDKRDYYEVLGVDKNADEKTIKKAYREFCHTTCGILGTAPLVKYDLIDRKSIIIDSKTGVSGAGRGLNRDMLFCETNENTKAYKVAGHRHTPEIEEQLSYVAGEEIVISFTPVLVPMNRGILATIYATLKDGVTESDIRKAYENMYGNEYFIRLSAAGELPESKWVKASNFVDIGFKIDTRTNRVMARSLLSSLDVRDDHSLLGGIVRFFERAGFEVIGYRDILSDLLATEGRIAGREATENEMDDVFYGVKILNSYARTGIDNMGEVKKSG